MMNRLEDDSFLRAVVIVADADGVSISEVAKRGIDDLALRLALFQRQLDKGSA